MRPKAVIAILLVWYDCLDTPLAMVWGEAARGHTVDVVIAFVFLHQLTSP